MNLNICGALTMPNSNAYTNNSSSSFDLKIIPHSKRTNIYYLFHCKVMQKVA